MYETPQKNLSLTQQMTEILDIYPSNFGQWYHPRGSITIFVLYQFELGMTQRLIWHMTQASATKSFVDTTQIKCELVPNRNLAKKISKFYGFFFEFAGFEIFAPKLVGTVCNFLGSLL